MTVRTGVKINLGLRVLGKRPDGYHELETLFVPFDGFGDELTIEPADSFGISIEGGGWDPMSDLTARAWKLLHEEAGIPPVNIRLVKGAPVGAGLGGCVIALVEKSAADSVLADLARTGFTAFNCEPSPGSRVEY